MTETRKWSAVLDTMPPEPPRLRVQGQVRAPSSGYTARLVPVDTPDGPAEVLELELVLTPPSSPDTEVFTWIDVTERLERPRDAPLLHTVIIREKDAILASIHVEIVA
ncbi:hypothetical protein [Salinarimonas rosea]|uniref:hypothetical protein n=1 Tax=Salinarimonas rosea TaxID=552063 RepID=UPI0004276228|nr:hypothetical protein [Salinarimonas rosea]